MYGAVAMLADSLRRGGRGIFSGGPRGDAAKVREGWRRTVCRAVGQWDGAGGRGGAEKRAEARAERSAEGHRRV